MFHLSTIEPETYATLKTIFSVDEISKSFALAGGTSLALQLGHRKSIDLDIFSPTIFDTSNLEKFFYSEATFDFQLSNRNRSMLFCYIKKVKCDFICEPAKLIKPFFDYDGVFYFSIEDIAAMKMHTICGRGKKKDFFDIYVLIENFGWKNLLKWFELKYGDSQFYFLWRSISYFADADEDPEINSLAPYAKSWEDVKEFIKINCI